MSGNKRMLVERALGAVLGVALIGVTPVGCGAAASSMGGHAAGDATVVAAADR